MSSTLVFSEVPSGSPDFMYDLAMATNADQSPLKIDLGVGVYRNEHGQYHEFKTVTEAKRRSEEKNLGHDYLVTTGIPSFLKAGSQLPFGKNHNLYLASVQTIGGTGANRVGAVFLRNHWPKPLGKGTENQTKVFVGTPTWGNYKPLFNQAGLQVETYQHFDHKIGQLDFQSILTTARSAPSQSIFILQASCHNPTGDDMSQEQWTQLAQDIKSKGHFAFFDAAYQGFGSMSTDHDADVFPIRHFVQQGIPTLVCQSFSKNMGLYSERVGALHVVCPNAKIAANVFDNLRSYIRWEYSSPPAFGARLAEIIMTDPKLNEEWRLELSAACKRIKDNRKRLHGLLTEKGTPGNKTWDHITTDNGLFSMLKLTEAQVALLTSEYHVHMPKTGRINLAGLNESNIERVAECILKVLST